MKYIGRKYIPIDNSYAVNVTNPIRYIKGYEHIGKVIGNDYLAGTNSTNPVICEVVSTPFKAKVVHGGMGNKPFEKEMIMVKNLETGDTSMVLYYPEGFNVKERVKAINRHNEINKNKLPQLIIS